MASTDDTPRDARIAHARDLRRRLAERLRNALIRKALRSFSAFAQQAIAAGVVEGIKKVEWGQHLETYCFELQMQAEAWLVANGPDRDSRAWPAWAEQHARMIARQRAAWERTGATWEDGEPEPWLRYVLVQNAVDNLAPGTLKSTLAMVLLNAWIWLHCPTFSFGAVSGVDANVTRDSNSTRELVGSRWYRETFSVSWQAREMSAEERARAEAAEEQDAEAADIKVRHDRNAVSEWATTAGGKRISRTLTRGLTGMHVDGVYVDDADDADRVWSEPQRTHVQNRWTRACENRVNDEHRSIRRSLQQIVHPVCLSVYLLSIARWTPQNPKGWAQFCLPAEYGYGPKDAPAETPWGTRDWRTEKGEVLHRRLSPGVLRNKSEAMGSLAYRLQYNQDADAVKDGIFKRECSRFFVFEGTVVASLRKRPDFAPTREQSPPITVRLADLKNITLSIDAANSLDPDPKSKRSSAVGLTITGDLPNSEETCWIHDATRVLGVSATYQAIYKLISEWALDRLLVEMKALGAGVVDEITKAIRRGWYINDEGKQVPLRGPDGRPTRAVVEQYDPGRESKDQRNIALVPPWEQGKILLLDGAAWLYETTADGKVLDEGAYSEVVSWPNSRRRDRMDSLSQAIASKRGKVDTTAQVKATIKARALMAR